MQFENREQAGVQLAKRLKKEGMRADLVLAIPRGGVVVGAQIAKRLEIPLAVVITKKIGAPDNEELAVGAIAEDGKAVYGCQAVKNMSKQSGDWEAKEGQVRGKIAEYQQKFRKGQDLEVKDKEIILADDGIATGLTAEAAIGWLRSRNCRKIILAVPVGASETIAELEKTVEKTVCLERVVGFSAVGEFYRDFGQVEDKQVVNILFHQARR